MVMLPAMQAFDITHYTHMYCIAQSKHANISIYVCLYLFTYLFIYEYLCMYNVHIDPYLYQGVENLLSYNYTKSMFPLFIHYL